MLLILREGRLEKDIIKLGNKATTATEFIVVEVIAG